MPILNINDKLTIGSLKELYNYMKLNQPLEVCDIIIGCGCADLEIPVKCANLYKQGYAKKVLFAGGLGKITKDKFAKPEAIIYKEIAIREGIKEEDILIEDKSTNTGDNFRFAINILNKNNIKYDKILIVHKSVNERRTLSSAKAIFKDKDIIITSPDNSFDLFIKHLDESSPERTEQIIGTLLGDIQRMIIYPQFGWQVENKVPNSVINAYNYLKKLGYTKYIFNKQEIQKLIDKYGTIKEANYFN